jgi:hypothetical protein
MTQKSAVLIYIASGYCLCTPQTFHQSSVMPPIYSAVTALLAQAVRVSIPDSLWTPAGYKVKGSWGVLLTADLRLVLNRTYRCMATE